MKTKTPIPKGTSSNFQTILAANTEDRICLMRVHDTLTDSDATLICAVNFIDEEYEFVPLAIMIEEDPFVRFIPPSP